MDAEQLPVDLHLDRLGLLRVVAHGRLASAPCRHGSTAAADWSRDERRRGRRRARTRPARRGAPTRPRGRHGHASSIRRMVRGPQENAAKTDRTVRATGPGGASTRHNDAVPPSGRWPASSCWPDPRASGKSRLAAATGLPVLRLDDFYRSGDDPALPRDRPRRQRRAGRLGRPAARGTPTRRCGRSASWPPPAGRWRRSTTSAATARSGTHDGRPRRRPALRGRGHLRPGDRGGLRRARRAGARPCACASTRSSRSGGGSPATCASTASRRSSWYDAAGP